MDFYLGGLWDMCLNKLCNARILLKKILKTIFRLPLLSTGLSLRFLPKRRRKKIGQQQPVFPGGHPSKYWLVSTLLNFSDRTRTDIFAFIFFVLLCAQVCHSGKLKVWYDFAVQGVPTWTVLHVIVFQNNIGNRAIWIWDSFKEQFFDTINNKLWYINKIWKYVIEICKQPFNENRELSHYYFK